MVGSLGALVLDRSKGWRGRTGNRGKESVVRSMPRRRKNIRLLAGCGQTARAVQKQEALARARTAASARRPSLARQLGSASLRRALELEGTRVDACFCCDFVGEGFPESGMLV